MKGLRHKHLVIFYQAIETTSRHYIAMELAPGGDVLERVQRAGPCAEGLAGRWFAQLVLAVAYLHSKSIVHRCAHLSLAAPSPTAFPCHQHPGPPSPPTFCSPGALPHPASVPHHPFPTHISLFPSLSGASHHPLPLVPITALFPITPVMLMAPVPIPPAHSCNAHHPLVPAPLTGLPSAHHYLVCHPFLPVRPMAQVPITPCPLPCRDLKLENLLLDKQENIKVSDFGFARAMSGGSGLVLAGDGAAAVPALLSQTYCGSFAYACPEILLGMPYDPFLADVWSLGVILYTLLVAHLPFDDTNLKRLLRDTQRDVVFPAQPSVPEDCKVPTTVRGQEILHGELGECVCWGAVRECSGHEIGQRALGGQQGVWESRTDPGP